MAFSYSQNSFKFADNEVAQKHYDPQNFTVAAYKEQIGALSSAGYEFTSVADSSAAEAEKTVVLRHDEPFSPLQSLKIAKINDEMDVQGIFFFDTESDFYDISEEFTQKIIAEIAGLGQEIGLKVSPRAEDGSVLSEEALQDKVTAQAALLEAAIGQPVSAFAYDLAGLNAHDFPSDNIADLTNVYGHTFADGLSRTYLSNSNGMHLYGKNVEDLIADGAEHLHVLVHPCWISNEPMLPYQRLQGLPEVEGKADALKSYLDNVHAGGRAIAGDGYLPDLDAHMQALIDEQDQPDMSQRNNDRQLRP